VQFCGSYVDWGNSTILYAAIKDAQVSDEFQCGENVCLWGTALLIRKSLIEKIGYLNEKFFAYWEDTDYSIRSIRSGFRNMVESLAKVYHENQSPEEGIPNKGNHYYYFMIRNEYFLWVQYVKGLKKILYLKKYLAKVIGNAASFRFYLGKEFADACFDGAWSAFRGVGGPWDKNIKMPFILMKIFSWHPYFLENLLNGEFLNIFSETLKRVKVKLLRICNNG